MIYKLTTFHFYHNRNEDNNSGVDKEVKKNIVLMKIVKEITRIAIKKIMFNRNIFLYENRIRCKFL